MSSNNPEGLNEFQAELRIHDYEEISQQAAALSEELGVKPLPLYPMTRGERAISHNLSQVLDTGIRNIEILNPVKSGLGRFYVERMYRGKGWMPAGGGFGGGYTEHEPDTAALRISVGFSLGELSVEECFIDPEVYFDKTASAVQRAASIHGDLDAVKMALSIFTASQADQ